MKLRVLSLFSCLLPTILASPRISGGQDAPEGKYPYQVSVRFEGTHTCGGSIIKEHWILTAAHCVKNRKPNELSVAVGSNKMMGPSEQVYEVEFAVAHKDFSHNWDARNDIGLARTKLAIDFNDRVQPISLPKVDVKDPGTLAVLTGWGLSRIGSGLPTNLQEITLKIHDQGSCESRWSRMPYFVGDNQICTYNKVGQGICKGDSGGPLVVDGVQIGVASFGYPCAEGSPDVFTKVYAYLDWIETQITNNDVKSS